MMQQKRGKDVAPTKILSVRLPLEEAKRVDAMAKAAGLRRNDYIRLCLKENANLVDPRKFSAMIEQLRNLERRQEEHLERLDDLVASARSGELPEEVKRAIERQMEEGERLMEELFKAQRKAVQILDAIRSKVNQP